MTKQELEQLKSLREEKRELEKKIDSVVSEGEVKLADRVQASLSEFPFTRCTVTVEAQDRKAEARRREFLKEKAELLREREKTVQGLEKRIVAYINAVPDSRIRRMMEMKYMEGKTWVQIGFCMNCERSTAEKAVTRYIKNHPEEPGKKKF